VRTIGDAVLLRVSDPGEAIGLGVRIAAGVLRGHAAPEVAVGMHHGPTIERDGDYYGAAVNIAARVSAPATSGEVLVTGTTAAASVSTGHTMLDLPERGAAFRIAIRPADTPGGRLGQPPGEPAEARYPQEGNF
jgi:adenylate cyclase